MIRVFLIRHGESESNAGFPSDDPESIPLTTLGHRQAEQIARVFSELPALIVTSPYLRARQTAQPTISRFPSVLCLEWPIQEFTYLGDLHGHPTTAQDRHPPHPGISEPGRSLTQQRWGRVIRRPAAPRQGLPGSAQRAAIRTGRGLHARTVHTSRRLDTADRYHHAERRGDAKLPPLRRLLSHPQRQRRRTALRGRYHPQASWWLHGAPARSPGATCALRRANRLRGKATATQDQHCMHDQRMTACRASELPRRGLSVLEWFPLQHGSVTAVG
jgi:hypothetical protein